jgi:hypothetical protein
MASLAEERLARVSLIASRDIAASRDEPKLHDIIDDPITRRLMASDGVDRRSLSLILGEARAKLARRPR